LRQGKFARAIAITEGLSQRLPEDVEVRQWQGIIYLAWSTKLLKEGQEHQARTYLRKALLADPHNLKLRRQVEQLMSGIRITAV
jgi:Tfp pilus assembly protein PilF